MPWFAAAIPYIAAGVAAYGAIQQGQAAKAAAKFNSTIADQNATLARQEAIVAADQQRRENYIRLGAIRAAQGKAGGTAESGSVLDVIGDTVAQGELVKQRIIYAGEIKAQGYQSTSMLDTMQGKQAEKAGYLRAGTELLGGYSQANIKRT
jgi:hypothetical protein